MRHASSFAIAADAAAGHATPAPLSRRKGKHFRKLQQQLQQQQQQENGPTGLAPPGLSDGIAEEAKPHFEAPEADQASPAPHEIAEITAHTPYESPSHASPATVEVASSSRKASGHASPALFDIYGVSSDDEITEKAKLHYDDTEAGHASPAPLKAATFSGQASPAHFEAHTPYETIGHASPAFFEAAWSSGKASGHTHGPGHAPPAHFNRIAMPPFVSWHDIEGLQKWQPAFFNGSAEVASTQSYSQSSAHFDEIAEVAKLRSLVSELKEDGQAEEAQLHLLSTEHLDEIAEVAQLRLQIKVHTEYGKAEEAQLRMQSAHLDEIAEVAKLRLQCNKLLEVNAEEAQLRSAREGLELRKELADALRNAEVAKQTLEEQEFAEVAKLRSEGLLLRDELAHESKALFDGKTEMALLKELNTSLLSKMGLQKQAFQQKENLLVQMLQEERHAADMQQQLLSNGIAEERAMASMYEQHLFDAIAESSQH